MSSSEPYGEEGYILVWELVLRKLLRYSSVQIMDFVRRWRKHMDKPVTVFYHEVPSYYIVGQIIPPSLVGNLDFKQVQELKCRLQRVLDCEQGVGPSDERFDWDVARERIEQMLGEYGYNLIEVQAERATLEPKYPG